MTLSCNQGGKGQSDEVRIPHEDYNESRANKNCARCGTGKHRTENCLKDASQIERLQKDRQNWEKERKEKKEQQPPTSKVRACHARPDADPFIANPSAPREKRSLWADLTVHTASGPDFQKPGLMDSAAEWSAMARTFADSLTHSRYSKPCGHVELADGTYGVLYGHFNSAVSVLDSTGTRRKTEMTFMVLDLPEDTPAILGWGWFEAVNPQIDWPRKHWVCPPSLPDNITLEGPGSFFYGSRKENAPLYAMVQMKMPEPTSLPPELSDLAGVFSEGREGDLADPSVVSHAVETEAGREPPHLPIYGMSPRELLALREYLDSALKKGWIRSSTSPLELPSFSLRKRMAPLDFV